MATALTLDDGAGILNLKIRNNTWLTPVMTLTDPQNGDAPIDLTGYTVKAQVRHKASDEEIIITMDEDNGNLFIMSPATDGKIKFDADTSSIPKGKYEWDLVLTEAGGRTRTFLKGTFLVESGVTR